MNPIITTSKIKSVMFLVLLMSASVVSYSQDPGGNPDGPPPAVPFSDYAYLILVIIGIVLAAVTLKRKRSSNKAY